MLINSIINSYKILGPTFKKKFFKVLLLILIGTSLEIISLLSLIPIINLFQDIDQNNKYFEILEFASLSIGIGVFFTSILFCFLIFFIKAVYFSFYIKFQNNVVFDYSNFLANKLYEIYLKKDYLFFKNKTIPSIIKDLNNEVSNVTNYTISSLTIIVEIITVSAICLALFYLDFFGTLIIISVFTISTLTYIFAFNKKLNYWGELRLNLDEKITENIFEKFEAIKDIKINSDFSFFQKEYNKFHSEKSKLLSKHITINQVPKVLFELIALLSVTVSSYVIFLYTDNIQQVIVFSGILVAGSFKLIPGLNKILVSYQNMKFYIPSVRLISNEFESKSYENLTNYNFEKTIEFKNVNFSFGETKILSEINFKINKGDVVGIFGESGSGKTTLVDLICGLLKPVKGHILIDSLELEKNSKSWFKKIAYLSQEIVLKNDSILNNILNNNRFDKKKINNSLSNSNLDEFIDLKKEGLGFIIGPSGKKLSGGQKQRLALARTIYKDSEILILDEPTSSLDRINENKIIDDIIARKLGKTIIIISHAEIDHKIFDKIFKLEDQKLEILK